MRKPLSVGHVSIVGRFRPTAVLCGLLAVVVGWAQAPQAEVVPLKVGSVAVSFPLEVGETGVVPPAEGAAAYVRAVLGKNVRFSQCFFVLDVAYRKKLLSDRPTTELEDRQGLRSMFIVTNQACDTAFLKATKDAALASTKDKRALTEHFKEVQAHATKAPGGAITPLKVSPEEAVKRIGPIGLISESDRHFTIGMGNDEGVVITTYACAESRLVVFSQWTDQKNFPHCIERAKAFIDALASQTKAAK
jgi:hypothetical protein